jgi:hypothetical protein
MSWLPPPRLLLVTNRDTNGNEKRVAAVVRTDDVAHGNADI